MSCPECFTGNVSEETPRGKVGKIYDLDTYVVEPSDGSAVSGIVVVVPDAFGWEFVNNRVLADHYADKGGYRVYLPEFMIGEGITPMRVVLGDANPFSKAYHLGCALTAAIPWKMRNSFAKTHEGVSTFFEKLRRSDEGHLPLGVAGFCWGGKHAVWLAQKEIQGDEDAKSSRRTIVDAAFTGHPSELSVPDDIEKTIAPVSVAAPELDSQLPVQRAEEIRSILEHESRAGRKGEVKIYEGMGHGFCVRADVKNNEVADQANAAEDQCIAWFYQHFKRPTD